MLSQLKSQQYDPKETRKFVSSISKSFERCPLEKQKEISASQIVRIDSPFREIPLLLVTPSIHRKKRFTALKPPKKGGPSIERESALKNCNERCTLSANRSAIPRGWFASGYPPGPVSRVSGSTVVTEPLINANAGGRNPIRGCSRLRADSTQSRRVHRP